MDARIRAGAARFPLETVMATSRIALALAATVALAGCASMRDDTASYVAPAASHQTVQTDTAYIQRVEQQARIRGIGVTWINPPIKRTRVAATPR
jgi:hypothetical protein